MTRGFLVGGMAAWAVLVLLGFSASAHAQDAPQTPPPSDSAPADQNAPPEMTGDANAPPSMTGDANAPSVEPEGDNPPPPMDGDPNVPAAFIPPASDRPFFARFTAIEIGIAAASLLAGWAITGALVLFSAFAVSSMVLGRLAFDLPLLWLSVLRNPSGKSDGATILGGTNAGIAAGTLFMGILGGAVLSGMTAYAIGMLSPDWETVMGTVVAAGVLGGAGVLAVMGTAFVASLLIPVPLVWLVALGVAGVVGVLVPPIAVVVGQVVSKRARPVPGGLIAMVLNLLPLNQLNRPPASNPQ